MDQSSSSLEIWACIGVLFPFPFYLFLWAKPQIWVDLCGSWRRDPCRILALVSHFLKLIQFATLFSVSTFSWPPPLQFWLFFICGLLANFRFYLQLGESGMYYGERFGKLIPLATEAPSRLAVLRNGAIFFILAALLSWDPSPYVVLWIIGIVCMRHLEVLEDPKTRAKPPISS